MTTEIPDNPTADEVVPWLSEEQQDHWRALVDLLAVLPPAMDAQLKRDAGVNQYEYQVLAALSAGPDRTLGLSDLATHARCSLSRLSHALTRLERDGWVERFSASESGARRMRARLTDVGMAELEAIAPGHVREARRLVVDVLTPEQFAALAEAARAITAAALDPESATCREITDC
ncbi:MarR family winged helix-turn-helix transcriptional regulator [Aeromicrobium duanguangcaii]|uniref:MarR family winged helix-turn-helix transcriptional regulator n=1 Tax=Aeromicrobium duanguangcaii TaxID=2968086 RepID=A0ABY5KJ14_9ACTN|nr:MarR family winged helix-turn-helix transcriptional regulator [Aeromicrobium duanguangcaii]MCD9153433.1 MarR family winged helix-turn-helix transcriptional regulator [Aeromicrobium duanguangcaii]UUI69476.1 MarR family winged helix-turn-helix transcriptional regulator [Aeromicrobium duanguangcaii]